MKILNRSALCLRARPAFIEWCANTAHDSAENLSAMKIELEQTGSVYLINEVDNEEDFAIAITTHAPNMLKNELSAWCIDHWLWPEVLDANVLKQWFTISTELMTFDLAGDQLLIANAEQEEDDGEIVSPF